jgi:hypothetical protein
MNSPTPNNFSSNSGSEPGEAERTLRTIAGLPAPHGLEDRLNSALDSARQSASVLHWPAAHRSGRAWMHSTLARSAAAAAIVFAVAGGGWGIYSRVLPKQVPKVIAMPRVAAPGGFSSASAMRTPQTLNQPVLTHPVVKSPSHVSGKSQSHASSKSQNGSKPESSKAAVQLLDGSKNNARQ